jgi:tetrahydroxynaphthalene reductase
MGSASPTHVPYRLDGKVALVTGSSRGIGAAMAVELARCGAKIVINYANSAGPAEKVVQEIKSLGSDAIALKADVSQVKQTVQLFDEAVKHFGQLDIVCSNSGVVSFGHLEDVTEVSRRRSGQAMPAFILTRSLHRRSLTESSTSTLVANFLLLAKRTSTSTREDVSFS